MENNKNCNSNFNSNCSIKTWTTHFRGFIVKSTLDPITNRIIEERIPYSMPSQYKKEIDDFFRYKLK